MNPSATIDWGVLLTQALLIVLTILLPIVLVKLHSLLDATVAWVEAQAQAKLSESDRQTISIAVRQGVLMAEQMGLTAALKGIAIDKKTEALSYASAQLSKRGLNVDLPSLAGLVEAAVYDEFNRDRPKPEASPAKSIGFTGKGETKNG